MNHIILYSLQVLNLKMMSSGIIDNKKYDETKTQQMKLVHYSVRK